MTQLIANNSIFLLIRHQHYSIVYQTATLAPNLEKELLKEALDSLEVGIAGGLSVEIDVHLEAQRVIFLFLILSLLAI